MPGTVMITGTRDGDLKVPVQRELGPVWCVADRKGIATGYRYSLTHIPTGGAIAWSNNAKKLASLYFQIKSLCEKFKASEDERMDSEP